MRKPSGQAVLEYILLLSIVVLMFSTAMKLLMGTNVINTLKKPIEVNFKYTYQYGHPDARSQMDGGPKYIPQKYEPPGQHQNFRIFINPPINQ